MVFKLSLYVKSVECRFVNSFELYKKVRKSELFLLIKSQNYVFINCNHDIIRKFLKEVGMHSIIMCCRPPKKYYLNFTKCCFDGR